MSAVRAPLFSRIALAATVEAWITSSRQLAVRSLSAINSPSPSTMPRAKSSGVESTFFVKQVPLWAATTISEGAADVSAHAVALLGAGQHHVIHSMSRLVVVNP